MSTFLTPEELLEYFLNFESSVPQTKSFEEISQDLMDFMLSRNPNIDVKPGSGVRDVVIDPVAFVLVRLWEQLYQVKMAQSIITASGVDLDHLVANYFINRKQAIRATGKVDFIRHTPPTTDILIPQGTLVSTVGDIANEARYYRTTEQAIMDTDTQPDEFGLYRVSVNVEALIPGSVGNVKAHMVTTIPTGLPGIVEVDNKAPITGGVDEESDNELKRRVISQVWASATGTAAAYKARALEVSRVIDVNVVGPGEPLMERDEGLGGKVDIYVRGENILTEEFTFKKEDDGDVLLPRNPVRSIDSVSGSVSGIIPSEEYSLKKDSGNTSGSVNASDSLSWNITPNKYDGEDITVIYSVNDLIREVQEFIEPRRVITSDVLVRESTAVPLFVNIRLAVLAGYEKDDIEEKVKEAITSLINSSKLSITKADLIRTVQNIQGIGYVNTSETSIIRDVDPEDRMDLQKNQYFDVGEITISYME